MKNVLVIYYSQSGQLKEIADKISLPFVEDANVNVTYYNIQTKKSFPFPWDNDSFFDVFPETFKQIPTEIIPPSNEILQTKFDLVLLHFQVWSGVSEKEINESVKFGNTILPFLQKNNYTGLQEQLLAKGAVEFRWFLISMDKKANKMFTIWSNLILKNPAKRKTLLKVFKGYLFAAIWVLSPIVHLIELILFPITYFSIQKKKKYFQGI